MTLEQLRTLVMIADSGGVLAAAEGMNKTQPTVSVAIRKLEEELGVPILSRDRYRAELTPEGEALCRQARIILKQSRQLSELAGHLARGNEPELRIAIEASCPLAPALKILGELEKRFPGTQFNIMGETLWGALERLHVGEVDLAISPRFEERLEFESAHFTDATLISVAAPELIDALGAQPYVLSDLQDAVQVVVRDSSRNPSPRSFGFLPEGRHWYVTDHLTKKEIILAGMGWGRLHLHLIRAELAAGKLVPLQITDYQTRMEIEICIFRRRDQVAGPVSHALWQAFAAGIGG